MNTNKKLNVLFIEDNKSMFNSGSKMFIELFNKVEKVSDTQKALKLISRNQYDVIISDISMEPIDGIVFMKQIKQMKPEQKMVALVVPKDEDKLGGLIEAGIHAFVLTPDQFDQALEEIAKFKPYKEEE